MSSPAFMHQFHAIHPNGHMSFSHLRRIELRNLARIQHRPHNRPRRKHQKLTIHTCIAYTSDTHPEDAIGRRLKRQPVLII
jgi:hypothetical protein